MKIINLTQHAASTDQVAAGVRDLDPEAQDTLRAYLTFGEIPVRGEICERASAIAQIAASSGCDTAMVGGAPYLMGALEAELKKRGITPLYAFSTRESVETVSPTGETVKSSVFRHKGFVEV